MKKLILLSLVILLSASGLFYFFKNSSNEIESRLKGKKYETGDEDNPEARRQQEFKKLRDINTNRIPDNIKNLEQDFASRLPKITDRDNTQALTWVERGPNNVGGRTRALAGDINNANIIIAGGITGGMWKTVNGGTSWTKTTSNSQLHSATCLVQDRRTGNTSKWYAGTGEREGNSAGQFNSVTQFTGNGIFKSTDNGSSWTLLTSTSGIPPNSFTSDWQFVWNVATDVSNAGEDEVYAATVGSIYRSSNGGTNWTQVLGSSTTRSTFTDISVSTTGVVYASGSYIDGGPMNGIRRSTDGISWVDITPAANFPATYGRIVTALAPSNENVLYVLIQGVPNGEPNSVNGHQLWKYTYISGDGTGAGGSWVSRGGNLPQAGQNNYGNFNEPFDSQEGYDLAIMVKPNDEHFIILNAVNTYVSTDGFATNTNAKRIGGYQPGSENGTYTNHHADAHSGFFPAGSNNIFYSGHDGGISKTNDITTNITAENPVTWQSLNNGYNVTQYYGIAISPETGSSRLAGGFQDNGSFATNSNILATPWTAVNSGDGGFCAIPPDADDRIYSSSQNGDIDRTNLDGSNQVAMKPTGAAHQQFINSLVLDKNISSILYYAGGTSATTTGIWRNNNIANGTNTTGWTYLTGTDVGSASAQVSTISVSRTNSANVVYYGTDEGHIRKITNANGTPTISADLNAGLPAGYVSCIAIDPANSEKAIAVFSNYNLQSLWYTTDGGTSWTDIEGNLSGNTGPSIRWAEIFYVQSVPHIFLATSVGVYYTTSLSGGTTAWTQEAVNSIGNVVSVHMDYRPADKILVVGTHGRGAFQTQIDTPLPIELNVFTYSVTGSNVTLAWSTESETNNSGFDVERKALNSEWTKIGFVKGYGNSTVTRNYNYKDNNLATGTYEYRIKQIDYNGNFNYYNLEGSVNIGAPRKFALTQNYPNPFNPVTKIRFEVPASEFISLKIFDITGRKIRTLVNEKLNAGVYEREFNGAELTSGIYFYRIEAGKFSDTKKMMLIK
ncbi:MAG: T9SS type A sorting domain-containing protein [Candidatus Kapaibacterium sp.]